MSLKDIAEVHRIINEVDTETHRKIDEVFSYMDSRFDKQESSLKKEMTQENL